jgi:tRNA pseudouridine55 synthase
MDPSMTESSPDVERFAPPGPFRFTIAAVLSTLLAMLKFDPFDGALLIDKPAGPTSHDIVETIRACLRIKKVGHCGTLDPNATGLLVLLLGRATKLSEKLMSDDKVYAGWIKFGEATNSYDIDGEITATAPVPPLTLDLLNQAAESFLGDQMQTPPMVSATKVGGVPLYKLARKGLEVERKAKLIHVYNFRFNLCEDAYAHFIVACTKGTYVRSLAHELGQKLGCCAHLATLRRVTAGRYDVADAIEYEQAIRLAPAELEKRVIPFLKLVG